MYHQVIVLSEIFKTLLNEIFLNNFTICRYILYIIHLSQMFNTFKRKQNYNLQCLVYLAYLKQTKFNYIIPILKHILLYCILNKLSFKICEEFLSRKRRNRTYIFKYKRKEALCRTLFQSFNYNILLTYSLF